MVVHLVGRRFAQWSLELQYCPCCEAGGWLAMQYKGIYRISFSQSQAPHSSLRGCLEGTTSVKMQKNSTSSDWMSFFFSTKGHLIALLIKNRNVWMGMYLSWKSVCLACNARGPGFHTQHQFNKKKKKQHSCLCIIPTFWKKREELGGQDHRVSLTYIGSLRLDYLHETMSITCFTDNFVCFFVCSSAHVCIGLRRTFFLRSHLP